MSDFHRASLEMDWLHLCRITNESTEIENCYSSLSRELRWLWNSVYIKVGCKGVFVTRTCFRDGALRTENCFIIIFINTCMAYLSLLWSFFFQNTSSRRLKGLESLQEFIQAATQELMWLNEKEEIEVTRDWSSRHLNVPTVEEFYKVHNS